MKKLKSFLKKHWQNVHVRHWLGILSLMVLSVASVNLNYGANVLFTSVLDVPQHDPFDGTVYPIQRNADWANLSGNEYSMTYDELLDRGKIIGQPSCDEEKLDFLNSKLVWGNEEHNDIRNTKISCTVRYAGSYEASGNYVDGSENDEWFEGTHPAWDIKAPEGTPIHAIANGVVVKKAWGNGYGYYYVVKHEDVPDPVSPNRETTLYSGYAHMVDAGLVNEGDVVYKGQVIGHVGTTGFSTTNHIHFQMDLDTAPWHLYWPFNTSDYTKAGLNFVSAVNEGLGWDKMLAYTTDSLAYVEAHLDDDGSYEEQEEEAVEEMEEAVEEMEEEPEVEEVIEEEAEETPVEIVEEEESVGEEPELSSESVDFYDIAVKGKDFILTGQSDHYRVRLVDEDGRLMEDADFDGEIEVSLSDPEVASIDKDELRIQHFDNGELYLEIYAEEAGNVYINFEIAGRQYTSDYIYLIDEIEPFYEFGIFSDGSFTPGRAETFQVQTLDMEGRPTPNFYGNGTVELSVLEGDAELETDTLHSKDFLTGIAEVEFVAKSSDAIVIGLEYGKDTAESEPIYAEFFTDIDSNHPFYKAVNYLYKKGTINGYEDKTFRPNNSVTRIESLKIIFEGLDQELEEKYSYSFSDVQLGQWYSNYLGTAVARGVMKGYSDGSVRPTQGVNRVEFLKMLFTTLEDFEVDPVVTEAPYDDVDTLAWYAPYAQYAKENNLFPNIEDGIFNPGQELSRVEMAEVIYRFIAVQQNEGKAYNVLMRVQ